MALIRSCRHQAVGSNVSSSTIKRAVALAAGLALFLWLPASAQVINTPAPGQRPAVPIAIGYPQTNYWPLYVARDLKLFEQFGLAPRFHPFTTGAPLMSGMKSGAIDLAWTGLATVFMIAADIPVTYILVTQDHSSQMSMVVSPKAGIRSYRDLGKAKVIGAPRGTCSEVSAYLAAKKAGVDFQSLHIANLAPNLLLGALENDQIDAAFIWGPWDLQLREGGFKTVSHDKDFVPSGGSCGVTATFRPAFLSSHPDVGCKIVKIHDLALEAGRKNPHLAISAIQKETGLSYAQARESFDTLTIPSIRSQIDPKTPWSLVSEKGGLAEKLSVAADVLYETKSFAHPLPRELIWHSIDARYIKQFLETGCN